MGNEDTAQSIPTIGIIVGSVREGRKGSQVGGWVARIADRREDGQFRLLELADYELPLLTSPTVPGGAKRNYEDAPRRRWGADIDACDGFLFVTPEYNHGVPGAFKNAFDSIGPEWKGKAVGFVSYGAMSGARAVEQWRQVVATFGMRDAAAQVSMSTFTEFDGDGVFSPSQRHERELEALLTEVLDTLHT